jgi:hypothetical protein
MTLDLSTSSFNMPSAAKRFLQKVVLLTGLFYVVSFTASVIFDRVVDWCKSQDPRRRLLWDASMKEAQIVLIGDSVFISPFVDCEKDALAKVLERRIGKHVFNAAMTGADPPDFLNAARLLLKSGAKDATVIVDIMPTRFFRMSQPDPAKGNYPGEFAVVVGNNIVANALVELRTPLLILNPTIMLDTALQKTRWYGVRDGRNRVWNTDGDLAWKRFERFQKQVLPGDGTRDFAWIDEMNTLLRGGNRRVIMIFTPFNRWLIREYADLAHAEGYIKHLARSRDILMRELRRKNIEFIDASVDAHSENFADLVHPNASGDRFLAEMIADYLQASQNDRDRSNVGGCEAVVPSA